jgi:Fic family protein
MKKDLLKIREPRDMQSIKSTDVYNKFAQTRAELLNYVERISENGYLHWEDARYREQPKGFTETEAWYMAREVRKISSAPIAVKTEKGEPFTLLRLQNVEGQIRHIDMYSGGHFILEDTKSVDKAEKQKYLTRGIIEEAIASSQLEGASTTRRYAKKMIAENIKPRNESDWMILNNYKVMHAIDEKYKTQDLSIEMLLEMHDDLTRNTIKDEDIGRLREDKDGIVVEYGDKIAHVPPTNAFLKKELPRLIEFANDSSGRYIHPVTKAIILHFWIGYLHPFVDGNGRIARSIFYWFMLKNDYWAIAFLPISMVIKRAPKQYAYSYIYSEQDNLDFTYFYDYNLRRIIQAIDEFKDYIELQHRQYNALDQKLEDIMYTNERQKRLIHHLVSIPTNYATVGAHQTLQSVSRVTANSDIKRLAAQGLLVSRRDGKSVRYYASDKLTHLVR